MLLVVHTRDNAVYTYAHNDPKASFEDDVPKSASGELDCPRVVDLDVRYCFFVAIVRSVHY